MCTCSCLWFCLGEEATHSSFTGPFSECPRVHQAQLSCTYSILSLVSELVRETLKEMFATQIAHIAQWPAMDDDYKWNRIARHLVFIHLTIF